ncbi:MAG TPA: SOS response-associated peptidase [Kofleriaceae bacterium]|nr:SOS response-associated peptidase [Kofleriaceae bacterium]
MCGRYTLTRHDRVVEDLQASLGVSAQGEWWKSRFNVAPTQPAPVVIRSDSHRTVELMRWGFVPFWAGGDGKKAPLMINARKESLTAKQFFRESLAHRRCLVPADGFFEWIREAKKKPQPIYMHPKTGKLIAFAGLWAKSKTDAGAELFSFTIITGPANDMVKPVHDRMPVVLPESDYAAWLDPELGLDDARALLKLPDTHDWIAEPVSMNVNKAANDDASCIAPLVADDDPAQRSLF